MNHQSDFGYAVGNTACIACGSYRLDCCDGDGNELPEVDRAKHGPCSIRSASSGMRRATPLTGSQAVKA